MELRFLSFFCNLCEDKLYNEIQAINPEVELLADVTHSPYDSVIEMATGQGHYEYLGRNFFALYWQAAELDDLIGFLSL